MATVKIRQAKPLDVANLIRLLTEAHAESGVYPEVDPRLGLNWITRTLNEGYVLVADVSGRLVGTVAFTNFQFPWSPKWYLYLEWLFVQKKFRPGGSFEALITASHSYADGVSAPVIAGVSPADSQVFQKDKLFQMHGYQYMGGNFIRAEQHASEEADTDTDIPSG